MDASKLKVVELKAELSARGLSTKGLKKELVERLQEAVDVEDKSERADDQASSREQVTGSAEMDNKKEQVHMDTSNINGKAIATESLENANLGQPQKPDVASTQSEFLSQEELQKETVGKMNGSEGHVKEMGHVELSKEEVLGAGPDELQSKEPKSPSPRKGTDEFSLQKELNENGDAERVKNNTQMPSMDSGAVQPPSLQHDKEVRMEAAPTTDDESKKRKRRPTDPFALSTSVSTKEDDSEPEMKRSRTEEQIGSLQSTTAVELPLHTPTNALYVRNFSRPLPQQALKAYMHTLSGSEKSPDETILKFWIDSIKSHGFFMFDSVHSAENVRNQLHERVWPDERGRHKLWADFIPSDLIDKWIEEEESSGLRYHVWYSENGECELVEQGKEGGMKNVPKGPRAMMGPLQPSANVKVLTLEELFRKTETKPSLYYLPVDEEVAERRLGRYGEVKQT